MMISRSRPIDAAERSGVLAPANLARFAARWVPPAPQVRDVVDTYWAVEWNLDDDAVEQRIVDFPAITLSVEQGAVAAPFVVTRVRPRAWSRVISGSGSVFAIRLRPAGLAVLTGLDPIALAPVQEITPQSDDRAHGLLAQIARAATVDDRARVADGLIARLLEQRPVSGEGLLANRAVEVLTADPLVRPVRAAATLVGTSERTLQRALRHTVGLGPNEVARRIRLQEVVRRLSAAESSVPALAAELGYADQAHLINDFRSVAGTTPGRYVTDLQRSMAELARPVGATDPPGVSSGDIRLSPIDGGGRP